MNFDERSSTSRTRRTGSRAFNVLVAVVGAVGLLGASASTASALRAPSLQTPALDAKVQQLPAFTWNTAPGAAQYQFQLSGDRRFRAVLFSGGAGKGSFQTYNTAAAIDHTVPDGTYYWRVRATSAGDKAGPWSVTRTITQSWTAAPQLLGPTGSIAWPSTPLVLHWGAVPYASKYVLTIATDPALAHAVATPSPGQPIETRGTSFAVTGPLASGSYFWAVTPEDTEGHKGTRSGVGTFDVAWPTSTATNLTDLNPDPRVFDPQFSWNPISGAARYEVEVNAASDFPGGSKWCCSTPTIGTSLSPTKNLANNGYYWRMRAIDSQGNAGQWNYGAPFTKAFDPLTPSVPNVSVRDPLTNNPLSGVPTTDTPIVTWDPVPGASRYEVQLAPYTDPSSGGSGCDWSPSAISPPLHSFTSSTAWTPLGNTITRIGPSAWPSPQKTSPILPAGGQQYCFKVLARADDDAQGGQVISDWTEINGDNHPAFAYKDPPTPTPSSLSMPAANYLMPASGMLTPRTPLFTWQRVPYAQGYYVVIARDAGFTHVADVAYTNVPAYAPPLGNFEPLSDETTAYYWAVIPSQYANGTGVPYADPLSNNPEYFNKSSTAPSPLGPANGSTISAQPTFSWTAAENARNYTLQVSQDPTFGNPIDNVITDSTAFTSSSTYPADTVLYWRVRANDWIGQGLNWSPTGTFVRTLPIPAPSLGNATIGDGIPPLSWGPVQGAISYNFHIDWPDGTSHDWPTNSTSLTPIIWAGPGIWHWKVRANFPTTGSQTTTGGYSSTQTFVRTLEPPSGASGIKVGRRLLISWNPDGAAKQYEVDVSTTDGFTSMIDSRRVYGTNWAPAVNLNIPRYRRQLFWRVAAVDDAGNLGAFASGSFGRASKAACVRSGKKRGKGKKHAARCGSGHRRRKHK